MYITIRLAKPADIPDMAEVMTHSIEERRELPAKYIQEMKAKYTNLFNFITDENNTHYVILADNKTVGITCIKPPADEDIDDNYYEFHGISLHPDYNQQDITTKAMNFIFETVRNLGKTDMVTWVLENNANSVKLYEKCGFTFDGTNKTITEKLPDSGLGDMNCIRMRKGL